MACNLILCYKQTFKSVGLSVECRLLNQSYLQSIGVNFLPGYADPYKGRSVRFIIIIIIIIKHTFR